jgi:phage FluMu protein Com
MPGAGTRKKKTEEREIGQNQMVQAQEMHCFSCGRFLGFQAIVWGMVKIKCPNCKEWNSIDISPEHNIE